MKKIQNVNLLMKIWIRFKVTGKLRTLRSATLVTYVQELNLQLAERSWWQCAIRRFDKWRKWTFLRPLSVWRSINNASLQHAFHQQCFNNQSTMIHLQQCETKLFHNTNEQCFKDTTFFSYKRAMQAFATYVRRMPIGWLHNTMQWNNFLLSLKTTLLSLWCSVTELK